MVMNILSISVLLLGLVIIHLFEFNSAKATDLSSNRNSNLGYSNVNMMLNGTLQTLRAIIPTQILVALLRVLARKL